MSEKLAERIDLWRVRMAQLKWEQGDPDYADDASQLAISEEFDAILDDMHEVWRDLVCGTAIHIRCRAHIDCRETPTLGTACMHESIERELSG